MATGVAIEVHELTKRYAASEVQALAGVTFAVDDGEIFGFLGRNGAGKSTTVRILTTLLRPSGGFARVGGFDVCSQSTAVRQILGVVLQEAALDEAMTGREHLVLLARLTGLSKTGSTARADELLELFGLTSAADRVAASYSGGMRRRLAVALALVRRAPVLFLDEPTTGLDPQSRRALWAMIRQLRDEGSTVFLTTQYLAEVDELADRVAIVDKGRVAIIGSPEELKASLGVTTVRVQVGSAQDEARVRAATTGDAEVAADGGWLSITFGGGEAAVPALLARVIASEAEIRRLAVSPSTLEDLFVNLTGTEIESTPGTGDGGSLLAVRRAQGHGARR